MNHDLLSAELCLDPHPLLHTLRREDPVHWSPQLNGWVLTRFEDISSVLRDPRFTSASTTQRIAMMSEAERQQLRPLNDSVRLWMGHTRREDHLRFQQLLKKFFSHRTVDQLRPKAQRLADRLLDAVQPRGEMDFVHDVAHQLSAGMIAEMLGTPINDIGLLQRWSRNINLLFRALDLNGLLQVQGTIVEMSEYLRHFVAARRQKRQEDMISAFLDAKEEGAIHSEEEIVANCILLLSAGHETTASLLSNGMLLLLQHRDQLERLKREPELLPSAVEEIMRFEGPAATLTRMALEEIALGPKKIAAQQTVYLVLSAGNRDPEVFAQPDVFAVNRRVMKQLGFGYGTSYCLGAPLARMEAQVCFSTVLSRMPNLEPRFTVPDWLPLPPLWRNLSSLKVSF